METLLMRRTAQLQTTYRGKGRVGENRHLTMRQEGTLDPYLLTGIPGQKGERRQWSEEAGERYFGNYPEGRWLDFVEDVRQRGVQDPILIVVEWSRSGRPTWSVYEGNHRIQAALQAGRDEVPVEIRYFGHAEDELQMLPTGGVRLKKQQRKAKMIYRYAGRLYRQADYMDAVQAIHRNNRTRDADWGDTQDLLREMGWQVKPSRSLARGDTYFWTNADGSLDSNLHDTTVRNAIGEPPYVPAEVADILLSYMDAPKIPKKQPKASWKNVGTPAPWFYGAKSKPPQNPVPGQLYVLSFDLSPKVDRQEKFEGDNRYRIIHSWIDNGSMWAEVKYAVGLGGVTITNPQGKSGFVDSPEDLEPWGSKWNTGPYRVEKALDKLKFKSAFKQWSRGATETRKKTLTPMRTLDNTGTCAICDRNIKLTGHGTLVDHGYRVEWSWGSRSAGCFGVGFPPYEKSPQACERYIVALEKELASAETQLANIDGVTRLPHPHRRQQFVERGDNDWRTALSRYEQQLQRTVNMIPKEIETMQQKIDRWVEKPLPGERG